jgi:hypothetical protein
MTSRPRLRGLTAVLLLAFALIACAKGDPRYADLEKALKAFAAAAAVNDSAALLAQLDDASRAQLEAIAKNGAQLKATAGGFQDEVDRELAYAWLEDAKVPTDADAGAALSSLLKHRATVEVSKEARSGLSVARADEGADGRVRVTTTGGSTWELVRTPDGLRVGLADADRARLKALDERIGVLRERLATWKAEREHLRAGYAE